ncbi:MAG TPA: 2-phospho-L-lactate transferase CofD family protein, partial [Candidatus Bipolaricaulota bacterium]
MNRMQRVLRWLYPGIGVKRWAGLAAAGALIAAVGLLAAFGRDLVRMVYQYLSPTQQSSYWVAAALLLGGLGLLIWGINRIIHAIVRGVSPEAEGRASEVLYSRTRLSRGPRLAAVGGGTGLSSLLRGLKAWTANTTAVVTVMDDGGSSG